MDIVSITAVLGWATIINVVILFITTFGIVFIRGGVSLIHGRLFGLNEKDLGRAYFQYIAQYKIAIIIFNISPYLALKIIA